MNRGRDLSNGRDDAEIIDALLGRCPPVRRGRRRVGAAVRCLAPAAAAPHGSIASALARPAAGERGRDRGDRAGAGRARRAARAAADLRGPGRGRAGRLHPRGGRRPVAGAVLGRDARRPRRGGAGVGAVAHPAGRAPARRGGRGTLRRRPPAARRVERGGRSLRRVRDGNRLQCPLVGRERGDRGAHAVGVRAGRRTAAARAGDPARRTAPDREAGERGAAHRRDARRR